uniref:Periviserokinin n=1 Tax=Nephrops norvegicus TaxID=6829 RepID=A0A4D6BMI1_NEPNO|nr:periviserokinin [Nephrops norvegicus]
MRNLVCLRILLLIALIVLGSECRQRKRQDLIPFPRVGKRNHLNDVAGQAGVGVGDTLANWPLLEDPKSNWLAPLMYVQETREQDTEEFTESSNVLPPVWKLLGHKSSDGYRQPIPHINTHTTESHSTEPRHKIKSRQQRSHSPLQLSTFNYLLLRRLLQQVKTQTPAEIETYPQD